MKKAILFVVTLFLLTGCGASQVAPEPSVTLEPSATSEPSATIEPSSTSTSEPTNTSTPEYCNPEEYLVAMEDIVLFSGDFNDQIQLYISMLDESSGDFQSVLVEVTKLQIELTDLDVPQCMDYLKNTLDGAMSEVIIGVTYAAAGDFSAASVSIVKATTRIQLFALEIERLGRCFPNCEP